MFFFVAEIYAELDLSQVLIKKEELRCLVQQKRTKNWNCMEVCFFNIKIYFYINLCVILGK